MGPTPTYHPPKGGECETSVEYGLPLWAAPNGGYCSPRASPSPTWGSRFVGARNVGSWVGEPKPLGKTPLGGNPSLDMTYLRTSLFGAGLGGHLPPVGGAEDLCAPLGIAYQGISPGYGDLHQGYSCRLVGVFVLPLP